MEQTGAPEGQANIEGRVHVAAAWAPRAHDGSYKQAPRLSHVHSYWAVGVMYEKSEVEIMYSMLRLDTSEHHNQQL
jgi:hypothetical protein